MSAFLSKLSQKRKIQLEVSAIASEHTVGRKYQFVLKMLGESDRNYFAGSAFLNSPAPNVIPLPNFDEQKAFIAQINKEKTRNRRKGSPPSSPVVETPDSQKTDSLRRLLNINSNPRLESKDTIEPDIEKSARLCINLSEYESSTFCRTPVSSKTESLRRLLKI